MFQSIRSRYLADVITSYSIHYTKLYEDRVTLAFICEAYTEEEVGEGDVRTVLKFHPALAPIKIAVLPLSKKLDEIV